MPISKKRKKNLSKCKIFDDLRDAVEYASQGSQIALYLYRTPGKGLGSQFHQDATEGLPVGQLFSQDKGLLRETGLRSGMRMLLVREKKSTGPYLNLCGESLNKLVTNIGFDLEDWRENAKEEETKV